MNKYVLVTYFTINIKFIFVQRCLMGNLLSQYFLKGSHCQNSMVYIGPVIFRDRGKVAEFAELPT